MKGRIRTTPDCTGKQFGRLTVMSETRTAKGRLGAECICSCADKTVLVVPLSALITGNTKSCGCIKREVTGARFFKHGHARSPKTKTLTYISWRNMIQRVDSDRPRDYRWYKALGITVCDRWRGPDGYQNFLFDLGERPSKHHSIDRIDSDKDYEPSNCKWSTKKEQVDNRKVRTIG